MRIANRMLIDEYAAKHKDAATALQAWHNVVVLSDWKTTHDIKRHFATASFLHGNRVIFNIKGNKHRLIVQVVFVAQVVRVVWIGTHAEYSRLRLE